MTQQVRKKIIGIVASAGGPSALNAILKLLPENLGAPIVIIQHISGDFINKMVDWLASETNLKVKLAEDGEAAMPGIVYVAPDKIHMTISLLKTIELDDEPPVDGHKPSGTILLKSLAESYGSGALGIILSGMGDDGASGLKEIYESGGHTIAQKGEDCMVDAMPKAAVDLGVVHEVLSPSEIASRIVRWVDE